MWRVLTIRQWEFSPTVGNLRIVTEPTTTLPTESWPTSTSTAAARADWASPKECRTTEARAREMLIRDKAGPKHQSLGRGSSRYIKRMWPDWAIYWTFGKILKPLATSNLPKSPTFLGNFFHGVKIYHFSSEIILDNFYRHLAIFSGHTGRTEQGTSDYGILVWIVRAVCFKLCKGLFLHLIDLRCPARWNYFERLG